MVSNKLCVYHIQLWAAWTQTELMNKKRPMWCLRWQYKLLSRAFSLSPDSHERKNKVLNVGHFQLSWNVQMFILDSICLW